ncbi:flagellar hook capping FlgD N-terminal domain-containing protein [Piscinibacter gummiphilus]|uniref:Basal-body rod modification protein FlgD n=1 Tax=Piscinibacter gummiphilus TaxID=946333 RepID=A0A1W6LAL6_9BURK|nr:flagellar hook capping FlgD N-terminal domain-containing protein [Piscinibacter gummiphilus]ARN21264.1 flagellar basal body rod modification protein [Piscinibacter gummiphilus]ATU65947.1 flagellar basal body rod modification protein [Piscinibacter gummiphilus]GLS93828.1 basal-body rod modification protein FlgD [Piscinibacter gummiphilus]
MTTLLNGTTNTSGSSGAVSNAISGNGELSTLFTTLLVAQIRNQNPLEPQDPSAFVNQLTQLSQTESLQNLARQGAASASMMESMQVLSLGSQVGSQLMINTDKVTVGTEKIDGVVTLENASATTAVVLKAADGAETRITLGTLPPGEAAFSIDPAKLGLKPGSYTMKVETSAEQKPRIEIAGTLESVKLSMAGGVVLNVSHLGEVAPDSVTRFNGRLQAATN